jgi:hypothetical protein
LASRPLTRPSLPPPGGSPRNASPPPSFSHPEAAPQARLGHRAALQVAIIWRGQILGYRLLRRRRKVTVGSSKRCTFSTPRLAGQHRFLLLAPKKDGYVLRLAP